MRKKIIFLVGVAALVVACGKSEKFSVSGTITNADGGMLYFEKTGLLKDSLIDSVKLDTKGQFKFKTATPKYPELYRLRLQDQRLVLCVDSTEKIEIDADGKQLIEAKITNSPKSAQIQQLRKSVVALQRDFDNINGTSDASKKAVLRDSFTTHLDRHRREVQNLVLTNSSSLVPYFALYQQISGYYIFSPYVKEDLSYFRALATSFQYKMPDYERTKNLYLLVIDAIREERKAKQKIDWSRLEISEAMGFIDLDLKDRNGYPQKLSAFVGKPVVLDFSAYSLENSANHVLELREIHNRYAEQGLQIYQVSLDRNKTAWQRYASNIPWISVLDETGKAAQLYNVTEIPTLFLMDKNGTVKGRYNDVNALKKELANQW